MSAKNDKTQIERQAYTLVNQTKVFLSWRMEGDEALQQAISDTFPTSSEDFQADLFALICEEKNFDEPTVAKCISAAL